jgi:hypothetical protein
MEACSWIDIPDWRASSLIVRDGASVALSPWFKIVSRAHDRKGEFGKAGNAEMSLGSFVEFLEPDAKRSGCGIVSIRAAEL